MGRSVRTHVWKQIDQSWSIPVIWTRSDHSLDQSSRNKSNEKYLNSKCLPKVASLADRENEGYEKKRNSPVVFSMCPYGRDPSIGAHLLSWGRLKEGRLGNGGESRV